MTTIRIRTKENEFSSVPTAPYNWEELAYGKNKELVPHNSPEPLVKHMVTVIYHDENLYRNFITGRLVTGFMHMLNNDPADWCSKK